MTCLSNISDFYCYSSGLRERKFQISGSGLMTNKTVTAYDIIRSRPPLHGNCCVTDQAFLRGGKSGDVRLHAVRTMQAAHHHNHYLM